MAWDDDKRAKAVELYEEREPTPDNSSEIVAEIAEELEESPNGVRMILTKAGVYVKKTPAAGGGGGATKSSGGTRVSKADQQAALTSAIEAVGLEADEGIITKLSGKAAQYLADVVNKAAGNGPEENDED